jgi:glycolate oxidase iron-sulfur subunit
MTTCPSGVNYMHLVDQARVHIEKTYTPPADRTGLRGGAGLGAAAAGLFRAGMIAGAARQGRWPAAAGLGPRHADFIAPRRCCAGADAPAAARPLAGGSVFRPRAASARRVALLQGCAQQVLAPRSIRPPSAADPPWHRGRAGQGRAMLRRADPSHGPRRRRAGAGARQHRRLDSRGEASGLDAILVTTSGCGTTIKDYGFMLREDRDFAGGRARFRRWPRTSPSISAARSAAAASNTTTSSSPITRPVRCSTDRKSRKLRKNCFPRTDSW